jgi:hypothetical protein
MFTARHGPDMLVSVGYFHKVSMRRSHSNSSRQAYMTTRIVRQTTGAFHPTQSESLDYVQVHLLPLLLVVAAMC